METLWSKADLHLHSFYSDGAHDIPAILAHVAEHTDLKVLAFTDHDCITGALQAHRLAPAYGLDVVVSQEVTTARGHLLALFIESLIPAGLSIPETVERVHAQGGVAILAHPFDRVCNSPMRHWPRPTMADWRSFQLDGLEAINGAQIDPTANPRSMALVRTLGLAQTGGSDAHHKEVIGVAHTLFPGSTAADLRAALVAGTTVAAGRGWCWADYVNWFKKSLIPRTVGRPWRPRPLPQPSFAAQPLDEALSTPL